MQIPLKFHGWKKRSIITSWGEKRKTKPKQKYWPSFACTSNHTIRVKFNFMIWWLVYLCIIISIKRCVLVYANFFPGIRPIIMFVSTIVYSDFNDLTANWNFIGTIRRDTRRGKLKYECTQTSSMHKEKAEYQSQINQSSEKAEKYLCVCVHACVLRHDLEFIVPQHLQPPHAIVHCLCGESSPSLQGIP